MRTFPAALERLSEQFARLPGIGSKTAQRLAFQVLSMPQEQAQEFADAILDALLAAVVTEQLPNEKEVLLDAAKRISAS